MRFYKPKTWYGWLILIGLSIVFALVAVISAFYLEELWRGEHAWKQYQAEARARGTKLTMAEFIRPPIKDEDNFAAIPLFQDLFDANEASTNVPFSMPRPTITYKTPESGQPINLEAWRNHFVKKKFSSNITDNAAHDILEALGRFDPDFAQLRAAAKRPDCQFPMNFKACFTTEVPHVRLYLNAARVLHVRIAAELAEGKSSDAYEDFALGLRLSRALERDPFLISGLVEIAVLALMEESVHEGLVAGGWNLPEIVAIEKALALPNLAADCEFFMQCERALDNDEMDRVWAGQNPWDDMATEIPAADSPTLRFAYRLYPRGWLRQNQVVINRHIDAQVACIDLKRGTFLPLSAPAQSPSYFPQEEVFRGLVYVPARLLMPSSDKAQRKFIRCAGLTEMTKAACALERSRIARGTYPKELDDLVPEFLATVPLAPVDGKPLRYEKNPAGGYVLWMTDLEHKIAALAGTNAPPIGDADTEQWVWRLPKDRFEATAK